MTMTAEELKTALEQFTGTEQWYVHPLFRKFTYTEGVKFLATEAGAYWLLDLIFYFQHEIPAVRIEEFQCWKLKTHDSKGTLTCEDGNGNQVHSYELNYTDFPLDEADLWFTNNVLLLPSEY